MRSSLLKIWDTLRSSYWFIPSLMAVGAILLSFVLTMLDSTVGAEWLHEVSWLYANQPEGARALLSTIAGSMITVAGVTFSITIAAVAYASSLFGPRLLANFMKDRGNQVTLGTFIATFLYCLLVLRTVRSAGEGGGPLDGEAFVPHLAILTGLLLALASLGVLIYFIHHVPSSIHVANVVAHVGRELHEQLEQLFPEGIGRPVSAGLGAKLPSDFEARAQAVTAVRDGYLHNLDGEGLLKIARKADLVVRVQARPGMFVIAGQTLLRAYPPEAVTEEVGRALRGVYAWSVRRTEVQDLLFLVDELVETAARALSPGVNDPFTAMNCVDWLASGLTDFARRPISASHRRDADGVLRVWAPVLTFEAYAAACFDQLRPYVSADRNAALHMMVRLATVVSLVEDAGHRRVLLQKAVLLLRACEENLTMPEDRQAVRARYDEVVEAAGRVDTAAPSNAHEGATTKP